ncbi:spliceosome nuclear pre-mRNA splicing factor [Raphidocelis subcapitata]|uniref:Pre-mRNA-processing factor 19 n=1 Tax=Raphidocelis subcapitata TaxID=307507 RepID=A0A2V0PEK1_9CHLO|nr:spliceosome nuclear pre-mRNA splicing factor [Raphidocelis subcapitata]|eukprot:GBF98278.1 spliceosome nuclear pre-mRNA splicing factor [Raphidocelis subcapitata]
MFCSISGNVPEDPVVSKKTGHVFERRLIEKYVQETGKCPVTQGELALDDLLPLSTNKTVKPRATPATSIPGLLGLFHDEWDALMLEMHALRQGLHTSRQELSHALYQHDAACRVIARLMRERDEARAALDSMRETLRAEFEAKKRGGEEEGTEAPSKRAKAEGIPQSAVDDMAAANAALSKARKKRAVADSVATPEDVAGFTLLGSHAVHSARSGGILGIDTHPDNSNIVATAGADSTVQLFDLSQQRLLPALKGHSKRVNAARFAGAGAIVSGSADKSVRIWRAAGAGPEDGYTCAAVLSECHSGDVVAVTVHPGQRYFVTASADASWAFWDVQAAECLKQVTGDAPYTAAEFHPDGLILATGGADSVVRVWEMRGQKNVAQFEGHTAPVTSLSFSENGYHLATAAADGIKLWDLRKLKNFKTLSPYEGGGACTSVAFDHSGLYLSVGGPDARVYGAKQDWALVKAWGDVPKKGVTALKAGPDMRTLLVGGGDHTLRVFGEAA